MLDFRSAPKTKILYMTIQWTFLPSLIQICFVLSEKRWNVKFPKGPMLNYVESWRPSWISDRQTIHRFSTGPPNDHSCKVTIQLAWWFLTRRFLKFQPIRTCYWPWQPCWISDLHRSTPDGRRTLTHDKSSHGLWPGELKSKRSIVIW